jgi:hypothetical protein
LNFQAQMLKQINFIKVSCREYDAGNHDEAFRIASALRTIFHETSQSTSLLMHLNSNNIQMASTWEAMSQDNTPIPAITNMEIYVHPEESYVRCIPKLSSKSRFIPASVWWKEEGIFVRGVKRFTRWNFVNWGANKDGGSHVDSAYPTEYQAILDGMDWSMDWPFPDGSTRKIPLTDGHVATLRQIGFEALSSPQLLKLAGL